MGFAFLAEYVSVCLGPNQGMFIAPSIRQHILDGNPESLVHHIPPVVVLSLVERPCLWLDMSLSTLCHSRLATTLLFIYTSTWRRIPEFQRGVKPIKLLSVQWHRQIQQLNLFPGFPAHCSCHPRRRPNDVHQSNKNYSNKHWRTIRYSVGLGFSPSIRVM